MTDTPVIECRQVSKTFGLDKAVKDITLSLNRGELIALVGPNGSGKTTVLRLIAGFEVPDDGSVLLDGRIVAGKGIWIPPEQRRLGVVFQDYSLFPHLTVSQNIAFGLQKMNSNKRKERAIEVLGMVGMTHLSERYPHQLSGGQQQRIALNRSLAPDPLAMLLDEPFSNLDPQVRLRLRSEFKRVLHATGVTAVYVTHDQEEALFMGDRIAVMNNGLLEQVGTPEEIFHMPRTKFVAKFLGMADFLPINITQKGLQSELGCLVPEVRIDSPINAELMVRPDNIIIKPSHDGQGTIANRIFKGTHYLYTVKLRSGSSIHSICHHSERYEEGSKVSVDLTPGQRLTCFGNNDAPGINTDTIYTFTVHGPT